MRNRISAALGVLVLLLGVAGPAMAGPVSRVAPDGRRVTVAAPLKGVGGHKDRPSVPGERSVAALTRYWAGGYQFAVADGAQDKLRVLNPAIGAGEGHTLAELAVESSDGQQIVEVGWRKVPGDTAPKLFVFHWINGVGQGYGTGFVPAAGAAHVPGGVLPVSATDLWRFGIQYFSGDWWVGIDSTPGTFEWIGYFPGSRWSSPSFTSMGLGQVFGEVVAVSSPPCPQMGNGQFGRSTAVPPVTNTAAAYANSWTLINPQGGAVNTLSVNEPTPAYYRVGFQSGSTRSFYYGGDGSTSC